MLIRIFIVLVMLASGYLMMARSPDWRPWWSQQMARLGFGSETESDSQLAQMHQELAAIKQQFAELKLALQTEVATQLAGDALEQEPEQDAAAQSSIQSSTQSAAVSPLQEGDELASLPTGHPSEQVIAEQPAAIPRDELMKLTERMELRAIQYGE